MAISFFKTSFLHSLFVHLVGISCLSLFCASSAGAQDNLEIREYQIKSSFLYRFIQFAQWSSGPETKEITLCVLGENHFSIISKTLEGKKIREKPLDVLQIDSADQVEGCQVLFIDVSGSEAVPQDSELFSSKSILTVGESDNFTRQGGLIRFYEAKNKIRFEINLDAATSAGITFSSKLLKLAKLV